jgi:hypothetical protein
MFAANYLVVFNITNIRYHSFRLVFVFHYCSGLITHRKSHISIIYTYSSFIWFDNGRMVFRFPKVVRDSLLFQTEKIGSGIHKDSSFTQLLFQQNALVFIKSTRYYNLYFCLCILSPYMFQLTWAIFTGRNVSA